MNAPTDAQIESLVHDVERLVSRYVEPPNPPTTGEKVKAFFEYLQPITIVVGIVAFIFTLPPVAAGLNASRPNSELKPITRIHYENPTASSYLDNSKDRDALVTYSPGNLLDDDPATAWSECAGGKPVVADNAVRADSTTCEPASDPTVEGENEWTLLTLSESTDLRALRIRNGYQRSYTLYRVNPRPKSIEVVASDASGRRVADSRVDLADEFGLGYQSIDLGKSVVRSVKTVKITILSVWPAEKVKGQIYQDTTISDVQLIPTQIRDTL